MTRAEVNELPAPPAPPGLGPGVPDGAEPAEAVLAATAGRLAERNAVVNAVIAERLDAARADLEARPPSGPLAGVPMVVKALVARVEGLATTNGSALLAGDVAPSASELVSRFRRAGVVVIGLSNMLEL